METKRCTVCKAEHPATTEFFHVDSRYPDKRLKPRCKQCANQYGRESYRSNPEKHIRRTTAYHNEHRKEYRAYGRNHYQRHIDKMRQKSRDEYARNPEKHRYASQRWRENNLGRTKESYKQWAKRNPDKVRENDQRRRARKRSLPSNLTVAQWNVCLEYFGYKCVYCGELQGDKGRLHQEHFTPIINGGPYAVTNIVPACQSCNSSKSDIHPLEWLRKRDRRNGTNDAEAIMQRIEEYFEWVKINHD